MFGSVFRMQAKPGKKAELLSTMMGEDDHDPKGMRAAYMYDTGGDEIWGVAVFEDEKSYRANAESPEQDKQYRQFRELLVADPEWHDGTVIARPGNMA